jgi:hypothetical protein
MTPSVIEPTTFRLLSQCLNQLRHRIPFIQGGVIFKDMQWNHGSLFIATLCLYTAQSPWKLLAMSVVPVTPFLPPVLQLHLERFRLPLDCWSSKFINPWLLSNLFLSKYILRLKARISIRGPVTHLYVAARTLLSHVTLHRDIFFKTF